MGASAVRLGTLRGESMDYTQLSVWRHQGCSCHHAAVTRENLTSHMGSSQRPGSDSEVLQLPVPIAQFCKQPAAVGWRLGGRWGQHEAADAGRDSCRLHTA